MVCEGPAVAKATEGATHTETKWPAPKTDKPRPHVCLTCGRSFARLEHLKRHERSHTKEKPFECPECTRCFARRDLLLRHQQKLHSSTTPASRPRSGRRESTSSTTASGRVRKNSMNQGPNSNMRPRANTISHVDGARLGFLAMANATTARNKRPMPNHSQHPSLSGLPGPGNFDFRGMSTTMGLNRQPRGLPKIETHGLPIDLAGNLRTAPVFQSFPPDYGLDHSFNPGTTINPAQLHFSETPTSMTFESPISPFHHGFSMMQSPMLDGDGGSFDWIDGFDNTMHFSEANEQAIAESSPSAISTGSPGAVNDLMTDVPNITTQSTAPWQPSTLSQAPMLADYSLDMSAPTFDDIKLDSLSPKHLDIVMEDSQFSTNPSLGLQSSAPPSNLSAMSGFSLPLISSADTPTTAASVTSSNRHSSVTSICTDSITDATRAALLASLAQPSSFHFRHTSNSGSGSPNSEATGACRGTSNVPLPSTYDLQRYVSAYVQYFHPHLPFLHIPTLSFNSPPYTNSLQSQDGQASQGSSILGGGGCLVLAMAAIGALYEFDNAASKELFDLAKKMIQLYLEDRRKADMTAALNGRSNAADVSAQNTPLWLVQSMLLNVIYGHNCGDKTSADIASTHCAALVSLARSAELAKPADHIPKLQAGLNHTESWNTQGSGGVNWYNWKEKEEKKRTLYAVFILSSMLVSAYNHSPALTNSEILLDLPCDEDLWAADSPEAWLALGGSAVADSKIITFKDALAWLLTASSRQPWPPHSSSRTLNLAIGSSYNGNPPMRAEFPVSTFGCLVLINALHNYIWETRQRHLGRQWTTQETEAMHAHIEPALMAWQAAWASNPHHSLERPNPFGMGPLSADSIPLLDLAYVRLFVNLGRSKEAFWHRDFDGMSQEIARGTEIIQHADQETSTTSTTQSLSNPNPYSEPASDRTHSTVPNESVEASQGGQCIKRERHLRKAAFHAATSLLMSDKLGVSFADFNSRELPIQSAMCAFDCAQVLAEWVSTIQERVGRYLGVLGKDGIDFEAVPGIMLVDPDDIHLFRKIDDFLASMELKMAVDSNTAGNAAGFSIRNDTLGLESRGYGSKILMVTAYILERSAVWPGK